MAIPSGAAQKQAILNQMYAQNPFLRRSAIKSAMERQAREEALNPIAKIVRNVADAYKNALQSLTTTQPAPPVQHKPVYNIMSVRPVQPSGFALLPYNPATDNSRQTLLPYNPTTNNNSLILLSTPQTQSLQSRFSLIPYRPALQGRPVYSILPYRTNRGKFVTALVRSVPRVL